LLLAAKECARKQTTNYFLGWNALMITALCKAYAALRTEQFFNNGRKNIRFLEKMLFW